MIGMGPWCGYGNILPEESVCWSWLLKLVLVVGSAENGTYCPYGVIDANDPDSRVPKLLGISLLVDLPAVCYSEAPYYYY